MTELADSVQGNVRPVRHLEVKVGLHARVSASVWLIRTAARVALASKDWTA